VISNDLKNQFLSYINNEQGVKISMPILTGSSSYTEEILEGYFTNYNETWELTGKQNQEFIVRLTLHEFDVDADGTP